MTKIDRHYFYDAVEKYLNSIATPLNEDFRTVWSIPTENNVLRVIIREDETKEKSRVLSVYGRYDELIVGRMNCKCNFHSTWSGVDSFEQFVPWLTAALNNKPY